MYSANHYSGPDFGPGQFQGQMIPASDMGPQVIQFNFFGQDSQFPKLMSGLNFTNESDSDIDSDYNCGASLDKDPQGYPFRCTLNANKFERDFNNNGPDDGADHLKVRREFVTHKNPRKLYNDDMHQKVSDTRGSRLDFQSQNYLNPGTDWKDQNISSGFLRRSVEKSFNGPYYWQESEMMNACFPDAGSRQDEPVHYNGERLEPNERYRLNKLHERNVNHLQPSHTSNIFCGGNLTNFTLDNTKKSHSHIGSVDVMNVVVDQDKLAKPGIARSYETSEPATTQPDKKPAVAKYDLTNCRYCRVAKQPYDHPLYNDLREVVCAKLSQYKCPFCNATGKQAHTLKYCKENPILRGELAAIKKLGKGKAPEEHRDEAFRLKKRKLKCRYCRKLGRDFDHLFKDAEGVTCPELFKVVCELCGATGKNAHSKEYCKQDKNENQPDAYVAVSTPGIHAPQACNSAEPSAGGTATADVPTSTEQVLIPDKLTDYLSSRRSFENLHNSSTVLSSTLCVSEDDQSPGVTEGIVKGSSRLDALKSVSEVRGYFDSMARVKSGSNLMMDVFEVAGVKTGISDETVEKIPALVMAVEKIPALVMAVEKNPAMNEAVEKNPAMNEAVEKNPALNDIE